MPKEIQVTAGRLILPDAFQVCVFRTCGFDTLRSSEFRRTVESRAARKAAALGLDNILAPQPTYYINRLQSAGKDEPAGPGNGRETLETVYNYDPASNVPVEDLSFYKGIQACMWTEYISKPEHLEYMAFPRLIAVAEAAWSPSEKKNFPDFLERIKKDTVLFDYNHYTYGRHYLNLK